MVSNQILTVTLQGLFDQDMSFNVDMKHKYSTDSTHCAILLKLETYFSLSISNSRLDYCKSLSDHSKSSLIQNTAAKILTELIKKDLS